MAELPVWLAGIGTTGTLATGMYIILQDRQDKKRGVISPVRCSFGLGQVDDDSTVTLVAVNPTPDTIYDLTYYAIVDVRFVSGEIKGVGCRFRLADFGGWRFECDVLHDVHSLKVGPDTVSTHLATDIAGRTWIKERRKNHEQRTIFSRWAVDRRMADVERLWEAQEMTIDVQWKEGRWIGLEPTPGYR
jgi:hypothetical protein